MTVAVPMGGRGGQYAALIDDCDEDLITAYHWTAHASSDGKHFYARSKKLYVLMHVLILLPEPGRPYQP